VKISLHRLISGLWLIDESRFKSLNPDASKKIEAAATRFWENGSLRQHLGLIGWAMFGLKDLFWVLCKVEGGIYKRLDEHRELTEFLEDHCPEILAQHPCVQHWLDSLDVFLCQVAKTLIVGYVAAQPPRLKPGGQNSRHREFPRLPRQRGRCTTSRSVAPVRKVDSPRRDAPEKSPISESSDAATQLWRAVPHRRWLIRWTLRYLNYVTWVFFRLEGGIYRRLDEHREMMGFLESHCQESVSLYPWLPTWLEKQERFLTQLEKALPARKYDDLPIRFRPGGYTYECVEYPRQAPHSSGNVLSGQKL
jgi:hypothetical protein